VCQKIDAKNPVLIGCAFGGFSGFVLGFLLVCVWWDGFPLVVKVWMTMSLTGDVGPAFYSRGSYRLVMDILFRMLLRVSFVGRLVSNALSGVVDETSTESLILAQDERWRRA
jgi:hypothetical protein